MPRNLTAFMDALDDLYDIDESAAQQIWTAYRVVEVLMTKTEDPFCLTFLRDELDELIQDVTERYGIAATLLPAVH
jgi:hypothetical protein